MVTGAVVWIQAQCFLILLLRPHPIPIILRAIAEHRVGFGQPAIQFERPTRRRPGLGIRLAHRHRDVVWQQHVAGRQPGISCRELRVFLGGLLEVANCPLNVSAGAFVPKFAPTQMLCSGPSSRARPRMKASPVCSLKSLSKWISKSLSIPSDSIARSFCGSE